MLELIVIILYNGECLLVFGLPAKRKKGSTILRIVKTLWSEINNVITTRFFFEKTTNRAKSTETSYGYNNPSKT